MDGYFGLEVLAGNDTATEVYVNGIPFRSKETGSSAAQSLAIHGEVVPGKNRIDVLIGNANIDPEAGEATEIESGSPELYAVLKLQKDTVTKIDGGYETEVSEIDEVSWRSVEIQQEDLTLPARLTLYFDAPDDITPPSWATGDTMSLAAATESALSALKQMRQMLVDGDIERYVSLKRRKYSDAASAYPLGQNAEKIEARNIATLKRHLAMPEFTFDEIDDNIVCRIFADGRLVKCFGHDGKPALRGTAPGRKKPLYLQNGFSSIDGKLVVVR